METALEANREETGAVWRRLERGVYATADHRWKVEADPNGGWWLQERTSDGWAYVEPFDYLRDAKQWVASALAVEEAKRRELWIDEAQIEAGSGTIWRLRLMQGDTTLREVIVRNGRLAAVRTKHISEKKEWGMGPAEARAMATILMRAADLTGEEDER